MNVKALAEDRMEDAIENALGQRPPGARSDIPPGTLGVAVATVDLYLGAEDAEVPQPMAAAWETVRAAALRADRPAPPAKVSSAPIAERARQVVSDAMHQIVRADPGEEAAAAFRVKATAGALVLGGLLVEAVAGIADAVRARGMELDAIGRELSLCRRSIFGAADKVGG